MKTLILNGSRENDATHEAAVRIRSVIEDEYRQRGSEVTTYHTDTMKIAPCRGCFECWVRTPGTCVMDDEGRIVAKEWMRCDVALLLTPVTFGGYSSALKKAIDRNLPNLSPFFMKVGGEVHHCKRYERYPTMIGIGILPDDDPEAAALFRRIVERHATNLHSPWHAALIFSGREDTSQIRQAVRSLLVPAKEAA